MLIRRRHKKQEEATTEKVYPAEEVEDVTVTEPTKPAKPKKKPAPKKVIKDDKSK